jgi:methylmalonyl-CoA mutase
MSDTSLLAPDFAPATEADWRALVAKTLGEAPFESLEKATVEGLPIAPLYAQAAAPAITPRAADAERPWDLRTLVAHPDAARANSEVLRDLEGGAASAIVRIDPTGKTGVAVGSAGALAQVLDGVIVELAPSRLTPASWDPRPPTG